MNPLAPDKGHDFRTLEGRRPDLTAPAIRRSGAQNLMNKITYELEFDTGNGWQRLMNHEATPEEIEAHFQTIFAEANQKPAHRIIEITERLVKEVPALETMTQGGSVLGNN
jgi:hypothetical protein